MGVNKIEMVMCSVLYGTQMDGCVTAGPYHRPYHRGWGGGGAREAGGGGGQHGQLPPLRFSE